MLARVYISQAISHVLPILARRFLPTDRLLVCSLCWRCLLQTGAVSRELCAQTRSSLLYLSALNSPTDIVTVIGLHEMVEACSTHGRICKAYKTNGCVESVSDDMHCSHPVQDMIQWQELLQELISFTERKGKVARSCEQGNGRQKFVDQLSNQQHVKNDCQVRNGLKQACRRQVLLP